jgi:glutamate-ammonia-ligase adenylyltransferase
VICALGKFGGREMGFGSDIELLFLYHSEGQTRGHATVENSHYFDEFVRLFLSVIKASREGIFEIDLRLRPYGTAGPLASTLNGFREYYSEKGDSQQFERMALVKLRPVAGDPDFAREILQERDSFVYSGRPLDVENILHLRHRQANELVPPGAVNAKYSPGGLVEVEYYTQACQITRGHEDASVRATNTLEAIDRLLKASHLSKGLAEEMRVVYALLRRLIDALRVVRGHAKDLTLPSLDSQDFAYLARRLHYGSPAQLQAVIREKMAWASTLWDHGLPKA